MKKFLISLIIVVALPFGARAATFSIDSNEVDTDIVNVITNGNANANVNAPAPPPEPENVPVPVPPPSSPPPPPGNPAPGGSGVGAPPPGSVGGASGSSNEITPPAPAPNVPASAPANPPAQSANTAAFPFLSVSENKAVAKATGQAVSAVSNAANSVKTNVIDNPKVQQTNNFIVAPATTVATAAVASSINLSFMLYYLYFLLLQPIALLDRRRSKTTGIVYNALTKLPLDLAMVRLFDGKTGRLERTRVTDSTGRILFIVPASEYVIGVTRDGYSFPASTMKDAAVDPVYNDFYKGGKINSLGAPIAPNIPLDPENAELTTKKIMSNRASLVFKHLLASSTTVICLVVFAVTPNIWTGANFVVQLLVLAAVERYVFKKSVKRVGQVVNAAGKPVRAVVRLYETTYNKLVETIVTDALGRFAFLVGPNKYYAAAEAPGFGAVKSAIFDFTGEKGERVVAPVLKLVAVSPVVPVAGTNS